MRQTLETKIADAKSLIDVLNVFKEVIMLDTHVATLAYLDENLQTFNGKYGIWSCRPFPLDDDQEIYQIQAYYFSEEGDGYEKNAMVAVIFMDRNFINSLQSVDATPKKTDDYGLHSLKYGVILSLPGLALSPTEKEEILDFGGEENEE